jgi:hypothetical protein
MKAPAQLLCKFLDDWCDTWKRQHNREWNGVTWASNGDNVILMKGKNVASFDVSFLSYSSDKAVFIRGFIQDVEAKLVEWLPIGSRWLATESTKRPKGWRLFSRRCRSNARI